METIGTGQYFSLVERMTMSSDETSYMEWGHAASTSYQVDHPIVERNDNVDSLEKELVYLNEVYFLMHAFGDVEKPLIKSAKLMRNLLQDQMDVLIKKCEDIMALRGGNEISHEDVLFLMRRNKVLLKRLLISVYKQDKNEYILPGFGQYIESGIKPEEGRNVKICLQFLETIEKFTGDLTSLLNDENVVDHVFRRRLERKSVMSKSTNAELVKHFEFILLRSFYHSYRPFFFKNWLRWCSNTVFDISPLAVAIIDFLAIETVAGLVEKTLHMRSRKYVTSDSGWFFRMNFSHRIKLCDDSEDDDIDELEDLMFSVLPKMILYPEGSISKYSSDDFIQKLGQPPLVVPMKKFSKTDTMIETPITPHEIQTAFIHYQRLNPMTLLLKTKLPYLEKRKMNLICLAIPEEEFDEM